MCALLMIVTHSGGGDNLLETFTHRPLNLTIVYFINHHSECIDLVFSLLIVSHTTDTL
jgi:hypothetical protein